MSSSDQTCQELCTSTASLHATPVNVTGVCDYPVSGFTISDVAVTGCTVQVVNILPVSTDTVAVTVDAAVAFTFTGTRPDGSTFTASAQCDTVIDVLVTPVQPPVSLFQEIPCTADLACEAADAGFDPAIGAQEFIVTVTGTVSCYGCTSAVVGVQLCPPPA